jgi:hypothetical protein
MATPNPAKTTPLSKFTDDINALHAFFETDLPRMAAELPFELLPKSPIVAAETVATAGFELPKLYGMSQGEALIMAEVFDRFPETSMRSLKLALATVLLKFRRAPGWLISDSFALTDGQLEAILSYYNSETAAWVEAEPAEEAEAEEEDAAPKKTRSRSGKTATSD